MLARYRMFAGYNAWCNERLYEAAAQIPDAEYRAIGGSISGPSTARSITCLWVTASGCGVLPLKARSHRLLMPSFATISQRLRATRRSEDARISDYVGSLNESDLSKPIRYRTFVNPQDIEQTLAPALIISSIIRPIIAAGHALVSSILGNDRTPSFDLIIYQRETGEGGLRTIG